LEIPLSGIYILLYTFAPTMMTRMGILRVLVLLHFPRVCHDAKLGKIDLGHRGLLSMCYAGYKLCFHSSILLACKNVFLCMMCAT
jgi:hypothetical protein